LDALTDALKDKTTLFSGHSGVGKSTLINYFIPDKNLRVQEVSGWSGKGQHTTTFAEMFDLPGGGRIIDTPGVKEFGIVDMEREELSHYFPEMKARIQDCRFNNCIHINEPGCAVKAAVEEGNISMERFESYIAILSSLT
jgi:ribosome biogenesis GTPase / thiamine phosphate phosphatase